jgi:ferritin-like metal-binding protein YciE
LLDGLGELLWIERTLAFEVLPAALEQIADAELKDALASHLEETRAHAVRVEEAFRRVEAEPAAARSGALAGLQASHQAQRVTEQALRDLLGATAAVRVEHLELGLYDPLRELARALGHDACAALLAENRKEEEKALARLGRIAERLRAELPR